MTGLRTVGKPGFAAAVAVGAVGRHRRPSPRRCAAVELEAGAAPHPIRVRLRDDAALSQRFQRRGWGAERELAGRVGELGPRDVDACAAWCRAGHGRQDEQALHRAVTVY